MERRNKLIYFADYRCRLGEPELLIVHAGSNDLYMKDVKISVTMDGKEVPFEMVRRDTIRSRFCYRSESVFFSCEYQFLVRVTPDFNNVTIHVTFNEEYDCQEEQFTVVGRRFRKTLKKIPGCIDTVCKEKGGVRVYGWCADEKPVTIKALHKDEPVDCEITRTFRKDIVEYYQENEFPYSAGYEIFLPEPKFKKIKVVTETEDKTTSFNVDLTKNYNEDSFFLLKEFNKAWLYFKQYGFKTMWEKAMRKIVGKNIYDYDRWIRDHKTTDKELEFQRGKYAITDGPLFSVLVPVYRPDKKYFEEMLKSVKNQTYSNWELCLADGSGEGFYMEDVVNGVFKKDSRVKYCKITENLGIAGNTNKALEMATGDYFVLGDHDDLFRPDALYECARLIKKYPETDVIYTDEDKYDSDKKKYFFPNFKPDFNLDLLRSENYICHMFVFARQLQEKVGVFDSNMDGSQDYDMILRCVEKAKEIRHIQNALYSWRCHANSTAVNPESKMYAFEAGKRALEAHLRRQGISGEVIMNKESLGTYRIIYGMSDRPKVSIIIPNKDHSDDLDKCIRSIVNKQNYDNYEIIVVENNSTEDITFEYYKKIQEEFDCVKVIFWKEGFNYSKINNFGVKHSTGEYILLLNNDTEMIRDNCLYELVSFAARPEVGAVGARLLYEDDTVQHAGVVVGLGGVAGHVMVGFDKEDRGYHSYGLIARDYSAVTAACLMVRKSVYEEVGGLEEDLCVAFNDIDFCLKVGAKGYLCVYNPEVLLYHYESKSRGYEDTPEKIIRFEKECDYLANKWKNFIDSGDPHYNMNLTLTKHDFSLRE